MKHYKEVTRCYHSSCIKLAKLWCCGRCCDIVKRADCWWVTPLSAPLGGQWQQAGFIVQQAEPISLLLMRGSYILHFYYKYIPIIDLQVNKQQSEIRERMRENHSHAGPWPVTKQLFWVTKEIFTAMSQHLMAWPTFAASSNKIWFNNWSKTEKLKDCLWHCSLTQFYALRYLFQESCLPSQACKNQKAVLQMLKPSPACVHVYIQYMSIRAC